MATTSTTTAVADPLICTMALYPCKMHIWMIIHLNIMLSLTNKLVKPTWINKLNSLETIKSHTPPIMSSIMSLPILI
jgi:hypothetical protein